MKPSAYSSEYLEFIELFNREKFFEAHEVLELLWRREQGEPRDYYHGLIQIAAVFVHIQKGTPDGGKKLLRKATGYLEKYRPAFMNLDLEKLLAETQASLLEGRAFPSIALDSTGSY